jgi:Carboxylesterase family
LKEKAMEIITEVTRKQLDDEAAQHLLTTFKISTSNSKPDSIKSATKFFTVNGFVRPAIDYAKAWPDPSKVHLFTFNQGNPFPGPFQGAATHTVDALYQFQNVKDQFPTQEDKDIAEDFALALVDFAHGKENIPVFGKDHTVKAWGPNGQPGRILTLKDDPLGLDKELTVVRELGVLKVWGIMGGYLMAP